MSCMVPVGADQPAGGGGGGGWEGGGAARAQPGRGRAAWMMDRDECAAREWGMRKKKWRPSRP